MQAREQKTVNIKYKNLVRPATRPAQPTATPVAAALPAWCARSNRRSAAGSGGALSRRIHAGSRQRDLRRIHRRPDTPPSSLQTAHSAHPVKMRGQELCANPLEQVCEREQCEAQHQVPQYADRLRVRVRFTPAVLAPRPVEHGLEPGQPARMGHRR